MKSSDKTNLDFEYIYLLFAPNNGTDLWER